MERHDLIVLKFTQPVRGRELRPGYLPSDLLWGALFSADARLQDEAMTLENLYRVSSAFPYSGGEWLLPKPRSTARSTDTASEPGDKKAVKRLEFVNLTDFLTLAAGERLSPEKLEQAVARQRRALLPVSSTEEKTEKKTEKEGEKSETTVKQVHRALQNTRHAGAADALARSRYAAPLADLSSSERRHLIREARGQSVNGMLERQRNTQDRVTQATDTFTTDGLAQPQLAFLLETTSEEQRTRLLAALRLLADTGLGGMRTQGSGQFTSEVTSIPPALSRRLKASGRHILLSLTHPTPQEAGEIDAADVSRYGLQRRDGFLDGTTLQRQDVWMLTEGSLVPGPLNGIVVDVAPPDFSHSVWRNGLCVSVGIDALGGST